MYVLVSLSVYFIQKLTRTATVALEKSNLASLRETQYKDQFGNFISMTAFNNPGSMRADSTS
jgi:hypothetical protein